ncbi:MAG: protein-(glutamine-N5) methyltransferase, release factor-specific [Flavobacterium sp. BFFFF2]|nr:MAG: protein-(glutamine-N5) methyltransferase, release factor-specific [Flavobacterium sp. BFFFF2]
MTYRELKQHTIHHLSPEMDKDEAQAIFFILLEHQLNWKKRDYLMQSELEVDESIWNWFVIQLKALKQQQPIQYVLGETTFFGHRFEVNPSVLIPRPETEELVDWVLQNTANTNSLRIADLGCGSGCIGLSLAKALPLSQVELWDVSTAALATAQKNADLLQVKVQCKHVDLLLEQKADIKFDVIVSNPPYVRMTEKASMQANVLDFEPHLALFVTNEDPLIFYRKIAILAMESLVHQGQLFFEINQYLGPETSQLMAEIGFEMVELRKDIFGNNRMIRAVKP